MTSIRDALPADREAILALNLESEALLSPMDAARLAGLAAIAAYLRVVEDELGVAAFLLAFREGAGYDSPNYRWFDASGSPFLYVDRIAVAGDRRRGGLGQALYAGLVAFARAHAVPRVVCEYYSAPLNLPSQRFHARAGFREIGSQWLANGKQVSFQEAPLDDAGVPWPPQRSAR
jgi:predicted GNAT superfamily acetyltransferase